MSQNKKEPTRAEILRRADAQIAAIMGRIDRQKETINRLLPGPANDSAAKEIHRLHEELTKAHEHIKELEDYINSSGQSQVDVQLHPDPEIDPAEAGVGDTGNEPDWEAPVQLHRPVKHLPSL